MKKLIMKFRAVFVALFAISSMLAAHADGVRVTIWLPNSTVVYESSAYDSVRVLKDLALPSPYNVGVKVYLKGEKSKDFLAKKVEVGSPQEEDPIEPEPGVVDSLNINRNTSPRASLLEFPRLSTDTVNNILISHSTKEYGNTYSLEWDCEKKANRWTAYEMYEGNSLENVSRGEEFMEDPDLPSWCRTTLADYKGSGYNRGHLCPSADRLCSREQNNQTFYLSNMQPQYGPHNSGLWMRLESVVRNRWNRNEIRDTLYVVKAATIDEGNILDYTSSGLIVPKYFYMAVLALKDGKYHAIGIWTEHKNETDSNTHYGDYAITIDELEKRTGIDFFCNLPDDIEDTVEAELDLDYWQIKTSQ